MRMDVTVDDAGSRAAAVADVVVEGLGFWGDGLPSLEALQAFLADGTVDASAAARPQPQLLAPNERRRAPDTVALALVVGQAACAAAGRDPAQLPCVFTSTHGELAITDHMCETLAGAPDAISPIRFHNSVHNAAAGYWTIGNGCHAPATALSAWRGSFAQGLVEAVATVRCDRGPVLLVAYDASARGALASVSPSEGLLAAALVLAPARAGARGARLSVELLQQPCPAHEDALTRRYAGNAMAPMLPLLSALAGRQAGTVSLEAGPGQTLRVQLAHAAASPHGTVAAGATGVAA